MYLVRYGEIFLKSNPVYQRFMDRLITNIRLKLGSVKIRKINGRIIIETDGKDESTIPAVLKKTFGVVSFSPCIECTKDINVIEEKAKELAKDFKGSFAVVSMRSDKSFSLNSQQVNEKIGSAISALGFPVNLRKPDNTIYIEIRGSCYMYTKIEAGPGGLPYGTAGRIVAEIKTKNDVKAALMLMKRGAEIIPLVGSRYVSELDEWSPVLLKALRIEEAVKKRPMAFVSGKIASEITKDIRKGSLEKTRYELPVFYPLVGEE